MIKIILIIAACISFATNANSQFKETEQAENKIELVADPKKPPKFPGGIEAWNKYIADNVEFPEVLSKYKATTTVYAEVIISRTGELLEPRIVRGNFDQSFNEQLLTALRNSPKWEPARIKRDSVATKMVIPIILK
ncbi:MAG: energy transducer TonB [Cyclobacteriaceae bacterium]